MLKNSSPKYNRTAHLPWSKGATNGDKIAKNISSLIGVELVITEKIDGSNSCIEKDGVFARTHAHSPTHPSFDWLKSFHQTIKWKLPNNTQFFGENVFAKHSISYNQLPGFFLLFGVRDWSISQIDLKNQAQWFSWRAVESEALFLGVPTVPVLWQGKVKSEKELQKLTESLMLGDSQCGGEKEGIVVRVEREFGDNEFEKCIMKQVRPSHVKTEDHWSFQEMIKNHLRKD
jgi:hypothetical protein